MKTYAIIVRGDSYYSNRIKRESAVILKTDMHDYVGLLGMYASQNIGNINQVKSLLRKYAEEIDEAESLWANEKGFEDNLVYYEILSRTDIRKKYNVDIIKL